MTMIRSKSVYVRPKVHKALARAAVEKETGIGELAEEAFLAHGLVSEDDLQ